MEHFEQQGGIAFMLILFSHRDELYYLAFREMIIYWKRGQEGGRKHFKYEELDPKYFLTTNKQVLVPYLDGIKMDLQIRD